MIEVDGPALRTARQQRQVPLPVIAAAAGISHGGLARIERGEPGRPVDEKLVLAYGRALGVEALLAAARVTANRPAPGSPPGDLIARRRIARGWSQPCLAEQLNTAARTTTVTRCEIHRWEAGRRVPSAYWRQHLCTLLHLDPDELAAAVRRWRAMATRRNPAARCRCPHGTHQAPSVRYVR